MTPFKIIFLLGLLFSSAYSSASFLNRHFPLRCQETLLDTKKPELDDFKGMLWDGKKILKGHSGGHLIVSENHNKDWNSEPNFSLEGGWSFMLEAFDFKTARFFGYYDSHKGDTSVFPTRGELNGRIDFFNSLISNNPNDPAFLQFKYFNALEVPIRMRGRYFLEKIMLDHLWPLENKGHLFFHDVNFHFGINLMPLEFTRHVEEQIRFALKFFDWLEENDPTLAHVRIKDNIVNRHGTRLKIMPLTVVEMIPDFLLRKIDFGNGNLMAGMTKDLFLERNTSPLYTQGKKSELEALIHKFTGKLQTPDTFLKDILSEFEEYNPKADLNLLRVKIDEFAKTEPDYLSWREAEKKPILDRDQIWNTVKNRYNAIQVVVHLYFNK